MNLSMITQQIPIAIISASAALLGVIVSQAISILLSFLDKNHKKQILLRQKYEEMMFHFQDSLSQRTTLESATTLDQVIAAAHSVPLMRAHGLCLLYFPNLVQFVDIYTRTYISYYDLVVTVYNQNTPGKAGDQVRVRARKEYEELNQHLFQSKNEAMDAIIKNVKKYIKA